MILHLMAPFRTQFNIWDEEKNTNPVDYGKFWDGVSAQMEKYNDEFEKVTYWHKTSHKLNVKSRFRNVDTNSLRQPLNVINFKIKPADDLLASLFEKTKQAKIKDEVLRDRIRLVKESVVVQVFNNSVAILEVDIQLFDIFENEPAKSVGALLDILQEFGVTFGEVLCANLYSERIEPYLKKISEHSDAKVFLKVELFDFNEAFSNGLLVPGSTPERNEIQVNWVTRTLLMEPGDEKYRNEIIDHWLKDSGDCKQIEKIKAEDTEGSVKWLNYLFRENAYQWVLKSDGTIDYEKPFSDKWQGMLFAQQYYAAFEALNDSLQATLARAYKSTRRKVGKRLQLRELNKRLERDIVEANLITLEYYNNFGYYKREVSNAVKEIMEGWEFEDAVLNQVEQKAKYCTESMDKLHQKERSRSALYSDMLLLGIGVISIVAFMFQVIEYGRNTSLNAELAVYETNSWKLVNLISERPTDFVILLSVGIIILLFVLYYLFRKEHVLD